MRVILATLPLVVACTSTPPEIMIDISPVNVGIRSIDPELDPLHFDLQLTNRGDKTLSIESVTFRGDTNCSFTFDGPDYFDLGYEDTAFIRGWYQPTVAGEDQLAMEVVSNAENYPTLVVPICGKGVEPGTTDVEPATCEVPPEDQADCEE